jgi:hypothetical protein
MSNFWYLASPYSHSLAAVRTERFILARRATSWALSQRFWLYSPIVHCHEITLVEGLPTDAKYWQDYNHTMIDASQGVIVLRIPGWSASVGVAEEISYCRGLGKPIGEINPAANGFAWGNASYTYQGEGETYAKA